MLLGGLKGCKVFGIKKARKKEKKTVAKSGWQESEGLVCCVVGLCLLGAGG